MHYTSEAEMRLHLAAVVSDVDMIDAMVRQFSKMQDGLPLNAPVNGYRKPTYTVLPTERESMENGSKLLAKAIEALRAGEEPETSRKLVWLRPSQSYPRDMTTKANQIELRQREFDVAERERIEAMRMPDREPCGFCGVRGDIGCKHQGAHHG